MAAGYEFDRAAEPHLRPVDFRAPPFSFPEPLAVIHEDAAVGRELCLWDLTTLPV